MCQPIIKELPTGQFDILDDNGQSLLEPFGGPFRVRETAEATALMLDAFAKVDGQIEVINQSLKEGRNSV